MALPMQYYEKHTAKFVAYESESNENKSSYGESSRSGVHQLKYGNKIT